MNKEQAKEIVSKLCCDSYVETNAMSSWLLNSKVYFDRPVVDMSLFRDELLPENFVEETDHVFEYYDDYVRKFCYAIGQLWGVDRHVSLIVIERLMTLLTWDFTGNDVSYDIILNKLGLLLYLNEL